MGTMQVWHWVVIAVVLVLLFGAKRLPDAARGLGRSMRILKAETKGMMDDDKEAKSEAKPVAQVPAAPAETPAQPVVTQRDTSI